MQRVAAAIGALLLAVVLYAAFAHGAISLTSGARIEVAITAIALCAAIAGLWSGALRVSRQRSTLAGLALLAGFVLWSGVSVLWSFTPDGSWVEFNRYLAYALALSLAIAVGASMSRAGELLSAGFLLVVSAVTAYALGQKVLPGLHVPGVFNLNQTGPLPRLQEPLGYWNALGLFVALGVAPALSLTADVIRPRRLRLCALIAAQLLVVTIGLTYSRGAVIALAAGLVVWIALSATPLRCLMWLATALLASVPPLVVGLGLSSLSTANVALSARETGGLELFIALALSCLVVAAGGGRLIAIESRWTPSDVQRRRITRALVRAGVVLVLVGVLGISLSGRGLTGTVSHAWHSFTAPRVASNYDPTRLLSANSENRWVWWKEALGAFSDRPVAGWGAGSFGAVHRLYRKDRLSVDNPHSVPLQFLSETGLVGALLALGAALALLAQGVRRVRVLPNGRARLTGAALLGGVVAFLVHCLYDWDWDIPAVALPALIFAGVLTGSAGGRSVAVRTGPHALMSRRSLPDQIVRAAILGVLALGGCAYALSAALPSIASGQTSHAVVEAAGSTSAAAHADQTAALAARLDPLASAALDVRGTIAVRVRQLGRARGLFAQAGARDPSDLTAWAGLMQVDFALGDRSDAVRAASRMLALDPLGRSGQRAAAAVGNAISLYETPPRESATGIATPSG